MGTRPKSLMLEKDKSRGLVPTREFGSQDRVYAVYLTSLDPRNNPDVQLALAACPDPRFKEFLERIQSTRYKRVALQTIAKACCIDLAEFNQWWNRASTQKALAIAQNSTIDLTKDMVEDAKSVETACERCDGMAWVSAPAGLPETTPGYRSMVGAGGEELWIRDCPMCSSGKIRRPGDSHARDRVLEMSGLIKKGAGVSINVNNFGGASHASAVTSLDEAMTIDV